MGKKNRRRGGKSYHASNITAGTNGMQKVVNWNLQDAIPVLAAGGLIDTA